MQIEKHPTLYFNDGDIELSSSSRLLSGASQLLCIFRGILRRVSGIFRDMFVVAKERNKLVEMSDKAEDLAVALESIY